MECAIPLILVWNKDLLSVDDENHHLHNDDNNDAKDDDNHDVYYDNENNDDKKNKFSLRFRWIDFYLLSYSLFTFIQILKFY